MGGLSYMRRRGDQPCACPQAASLLSAYADRELSWEDERWVARHLSTCPECSRDYEELLATKRALASLEGIEPAELPGGFWAEVRLRITGQAAPGPSAGRASLLGPGSTLRPWARLRAPAWVWVVVPTAVAAMLLVAFWAAWGPNNLDVPGVPAVQFNAVGGTQTAGLEGLEPVEVGTLLREHALSVMRRPLSDGVSLTYVVTNSLGDVSGSR